MEKTVTPPTPPTVVPSLSLRPKTVSYNYVKLCTRYNYIQSKITCVGGVKWFYNKIRIFYLCNNKMPHLIQQVSFYNKKGDQFSFYTACCSWKTIIKSITYKYSKNTKA